MNSNPDPNETDDLGPLNRDPSDDQFQYQKLWKRNSATLTLVLVGTCALVFIPMIFYGCDGERDRWRAAWIMEDYLSGNRTESIEKMEGLVTAHPHDAQLRITLVRWLIDDGQGSKALETIQPLVQHQGDNPQVNQLLQSCLLSIGEFEQALESYKNANRSIHQRSYGETLNHKNSLAYFRALAGTETELALEDIDTVIAEFDAQWKDKCRGLPMDVRQQCALCAAIVYHYFCVEFGDELANGVVGLQGQGTRVPPDFDLQVNRGEKPTPRSHAQTVSDLAIANLDQIILAESMKYASYLRVSKRSVARLMATEFPFAETSVNQLAGSRGKLDQTATNLAAFLTIRAKMLQLIGEDEKSFLDRLAVQEMGFDPEEIARRFPSVDFCGMHLQPIAQFLDTRGCVYFQGNALDRALADLNAAVEGQEALARVAADLPMANLEQTTDPRQRRENFERQPRRVLAVVLYHRSWVKYELKLDQSAMQDIARIRKLGFTPGTHLF